MVRSGVSRASVLLALLALTTACAFGKEEPTTKEQHGKVVVGQIDSQPGIMLSQVYGRALGADGYTVDPVTPLGSSANAFNAIKDGEVDLYGSFSGPFLAVLGEAPGPTPAATMAKVRAGLRGTGIVAVGSATATEVRGLFMLRSTAEKHHLKTMSDLEAVAPSLTLGAPVGCLTQDDCLGPRVQSEYDLQFDKVATLDDGGLLANAALDDGRVDVAVLFTDRSIVKPNYVLLTDDRHAQPASNPIALVRKKVATVRLRQLLRHTNLALTRPNYNEMAVSVLVDGDDSARAALLFLRTTGLVD